MELMRTILVARQVAMVSEHNTPNYSPALNLTLLFSFLCLLSFIPKIGFKEP